jgi:hypothetical protein
MDEPAAGHGYSEAMVDSPSSRIITFVLTY